eukprot:CAMPEP_0182497032 /NCGR_PEP_ID=MMETSP1321-20130603/5583_1 /TAXON_ID=91990 /ORGANISM="Bolidomonas sp., Strain RCC1657" /LENGTH=317 /DNA_ID=CAMNT_0024700795 /DNA_START=82 /DNA_END=1035 /DNA_ORIENTATION=-
MPLLLLLLLLLFFLLPNAKCQTCGDTPSYPSGSFNVTLAGGNNRTFQLFTPWTEYECSSFCVGPPQEKRPLVINWHGCNAHVPVVAYQEQISRIEQSASDYGYYAITPVGSKEDLIDQFGWNTVGIQCGKFGEDDFVFAETLLDWAAENLCVDTARIYSTGFSTGAFHSNGLGCRMPNRFAGIAPIAGSFGRLYESECKQGSPVSVLSFHSRGDKTVPYDGNFEWLGQAEVTSLWEKRNGCTNETARVTYESETTICKRKECPGAPVEDCTLTGLDHCWVGGRSGGFESPGSCASQPGDIDATKHMFETWEREAQHL